MSDNDKLTCNDILKSFDYKHYKPNPDKKSKRWNFTDQDPINQVNRILSSQLPSPTNEIENYLSGEGMKIIFPSNFIDLWTKLEVLF